MGPLVVQGLKIRESLASGFRFQLAGVENWIRHLLCG